MSRTHRCDSCGKARVNVTVVVVDGKPRDLCPACLPPLRPSEHADRQPNPKHRDPLIRKEAS